MFLGSGFVCVSVSSVCRWAHRLDLRGGAKAGGTQDQTVESPCKLIHAYRSMGKVRGSDSCPGREPLDWRAPSWPLRCPIVPAALDRSCTSSLENKGLGQWPVVGGWKPDAAAQCARCSVVKPRLEKKVAEISQVLICQEMHKPGKGSSRVKLQCSSCRSLLQDVYYDTPFVYSDLCNDKRILVKPRGCRLASAE